MITFDGSIQIRCPPQAVFDYLCDPANDPEWQTGVIESTVTSDGPIGPGTTFDEIVKVGPMKVRAACRVTDYERPRRLGFSADSGPLSYSGTYLFESRDGGTRLTLTGSGVMRGLWRLLEPMFAADVKRESRRELKQLKEIVEHRAVSAMESAPVVAALAKVGNEPGQEV